MGCKGYKHWTEGIEGLNGMERIDDMESMRKNGKKQDRYIKGKKNFATERERGGTEDDERDREKVENKRYR